MSRLAALSNRLQAWRSFRGIAHATRTLASAQVLRWGAHRHQTRDHLAGVAKLAQRYPYDLAATDASIMLAIGSDLGLCGRLNHVVARHVHATLARHPLRLGIAVGHRLQALLSDDIPWVQHSAPSTFPAIMSLAAEIETMAQRGPDRARAKLIIVSACDVRGDAPIVKAEHDTRATLDLAADHRSATAPTREHGRRVVPLHAEAEIAAEVRRLWVHARVAHAATRAGWTEAKIRLSRMTRAHDVSQKRIGEQERLLNRLRREAITQQMLEARQGAGRVASRTR